MTTENHPDRDQNRKRSPDSFSAIQIPDGIPENFDPNDPTTWPRASETERLSPSSLEVETPPAETPQRPPRPTRPFSPNILQFKDLTPPYPDEPIHDVGSGRFRPIYVLLAGIAIAIFLPIVPVVSSAGMFILVVAVFFWRISAAFRQVEKRDRELAQQHARPHRPVFAKLTSTDYFIIALHIILAMIIGVMYGPGAFLFFLFGAAILLFWKVVQAWSWRVAVIGGLIVSILLWSYLNHG